MPRAAAAPERFDGFADAERRFFRNLARNQRRDWWEGHRGEYEAGWLAPMRALLDEVRERIEPVFPRQPLAAPKVFRIHRDVRFSKDKSPYKTHIGGYIGIEGAGAGPSAPAPLYLHLGADELFACAGHYMMDGAQLARYRAAVADDRTGPALAGLLAPLVKAGFQLGSHDTLQKTPRGFDPAHPRADLLRRKGLMVTFPALPAGLLTSRRLLDWLVRHVRRAAPLVEWLAAVDE
jgi:uncharacterized protein (TIGR02453 family)